MGGRRGELAVGPRNVDQGHGWQLPVDACAGGTEVDYALSIDIDMPLLGVFKRKAEQVLIDTALRALKVRVEA